MSKKRGAWAQEARCQGLTNPIGRMGFAKLCAAREERR